MTYAWFRRFSDTPLPTVPDLWAEARRLFARALANVGAPQEIAGQARLSRTRRREIVLWVEPVEKMVRGLIAAKAVIHLLMTPEGRKLLRESSRQQPEPSPQSRPKSLPANSVRSIKIPHPGWHTIWQPPPKPAPVVAPASPPEATPPGIGPDLGDPASWSCPYRVVSSIRAQASFAARPRRGPRIALLDDWITSPKPKPKPPAPPPPDADPEDKDTGSKLAFSYARRIETLRRVIENPGPAIRRLARVLAKTAPDALDLPRWRNEAARQRWLNWRQGDLYADQCRDHALLAIRALHLSLEWLDRPRDEPG